MHRPSRRLPSPFDARRSRLPVAAAGVLCLVAAGCGKPRVSAPVADRTAAEALRTTLASGGSGASTADAAAAVVGTGWGSLKGRFVFSGTAGAPAALVVDKDTEVCGKAEKLFDRSLLVDASGKGLANVVVFLRKSSRVKNTVPDTPVVFDQKNCEFLTQVTAARVGQPIDVRNSDPVGHNTNLSGTSFNQLIPAGGSTIYTASSETGMPTMVTCNIHPWMKAYAVFRKDGYVAVSAADGSFEIADLPAGEPLEFQVWHERSVGANGALGIEKPELKWTPKGRFQIRLEENEVKDLGTLEVPAAALGG